MVTSWRSQLEAGERKSESLCTRLVIERQPPLMSATGEPPRLWWRLCEWRAVPVVHAVAMTLRTLISECWSKGRQLGPATPSLRGGRPEATRLLLGGVDVVGWHVVLVHKMRAVGGGVGVWACSSMRATRCSRTGIA